MLIKCLASSNKRLIKITILSFALNACSPKSGRSNDYATSANSSAGVVNADPQQNMQNYLLIGAKGRAGKGALFKCELDGTQCSEFIGGNVEIQQPPDHPEELLKIQKGEFFASSVAANKSFMYIGTNAKADSEKNIKSNSKSIRGGLYKCDLLGKNCSLPHLNSLNLLPNDRFGASIFATKEKVYIGAIGRDRSKELSKQNEDIGAVFSFDSTMLNALELIGGNKSNNNIQLIAKDNFGSSVYVTKNYVYIGAKNKNGENGAIFYCNIDGSNCNIFNTSKINLITNDQFGSSISGDEQNIYVGAIGRDGGPANLTSLYDTGALFKCSIKGESCIEFIGGRNQESQKELELTAGDHFGSSVVTFGESIYIGAEGRKDETNSKVGAIFKCNLNGKNCVELIGGKSKKNPGNKFGLKDGDLFGTSITIATLPITENTNIVHDSCSEQKVQIGNVLNNLKYTLCNILNELTKSNTKFINAYSKMNDSTLILTESQGSFRQIESKTGLYIGAGTVYEYWGARDWISSNPSDAFNSSKKILAFGEVKNSLTQIGNVWNGIWDIRFIDDNGNILKASSLISGTYAGHNANYSIEKTLDKAYVSNVFGAFINQKSNYDELYLLKKDGKYDILDVQKYSVGDSGLLVDLFYLIPKNDISLIDYVIKLKDKIALFKKSSYNNQYQGYYLLNFNDIINKNKDAQILFVQKSD